MPAQLVVRDGNPEWYLSPDIWVVPGPDPNAAPGTPVAGQPAYLWARVANTGNREAKGVRLDYYWANPALQVLRSTANLIGSAFADIPAEGSQDVLCLVPWLPLMVNDGHECVVVVANHPDDPLPSPPPDDFNPPAFQQVAQKNLTVLAVGKRLLVKVVMIAGWRRQEKVVVVRAEVGRPLDDTRLAQLGLKGFRPADGEAIEFGLGLRPDIPDHGEPLGPREGKVRVPPGGSAAVYVRVRAPQLPQGHYQVIHLTEINGDAVLGGLGFVVVPAPEGNP